MALLIDTPRWPAHGRLWSHLISDTSYEELHLFAQRAGLPRRSFEGDHYDVPAERVPAVVAAGARTASGRELVTALVASGLRVPKRRGERVLATWPDGQWLPDAGPHQVDCVASPLGPPPATTIATCTLVVRGEELLVDGEGLPPARTGAALGYLRARFAAGAATGGYPSPRCHVALVRPAGTLEGRWVSLASAADLPAARFWWPLLERQRPPPRH